ncbi:hypothetical protein ACUW02_006916 [Pseudomonas aeruginosa]|jgi:hypothetical protein|uniref:hypothetical protein n=1 Tax=Pseudomonadaceae TaxID=135621 RepID=UPI000F54B33F|nr:MULTISPECIES: hypothetical protein [Pseudomonas]EIU2646647.1 hypothetical protein [Pseudomonas aeruginosa]EIU2686524.1 hypothetical protein [Pseudomonas aeruginosa]ELC9142375.1 hypothetical protein [Pseudomonas aeruginosa]ELH1552183.1 hypothetical protein [Pseudomonas aeruginosa]RPM52839.1 hypothetical protein IPC1288_28780 [Pseudomonas aeruginosa]
MKLKYITRTVAVGLFGFIAIVGTQFVITSRDVAMARESAILAWAESNPSEAGTVDRFRKECLHVPSEIPPNQAPVRPITIAQCAEKNGSQALASAIEKAYETVEVPAPLRWL